MPILCFYNDVFNLLTTLQKICNLGITIDIHVPERIPVLHNLEFWSTYAFQILKRSMMAVS